jgi:hypothetical protein
LSVLYFDISILNFIFLIQLKVLFHGIKSKKSNRKEKKIRMILKKIKKNCLTVDRKAILLISCEGNWLVALFSLFSTIQRSCD